jgi:hypothetical protein
MLGVAVDDNVGRPLGRADELSKLGEREDQK